MTSFERPPGELEFPLVDLQLSFAWQLSLADSDLV